MTKKQVHLSLQPSEGVVVRAAADIYSAYITAGQVKEGEEKKWISKAIQEAFLIAKTTDEKIQSDTELSP